MRFAKFSALALISSAMATHPLLENLRQLKGRADGTATATTTSAAVATINANDTAAQLSEFISILGLTGSATFATAVPTCLGGYEPPGSELYHMILTAVPGSVIGQLAGSAGRSSISAEFAAGNTPAWYASMPTAVQDYIVSLKNNVGTGCTTPPTTIASTDAALASALAKAGTTAGAGVFVDENGDLATSTSTDFAQATQVAKGSLAGIMAFVGLMAIL